jgi:hypothetical protein
VPFITNLVEVSLLYPQLVQNKRAVLVSKFTVAMAFLAQDGQTTNTSW